MRVAFILVAITACLVLGWDMIESHATAASPTASPSGRVAGGESQIGDEAAAGAATLPASRPSHKPFEIPKEMDVPTVSVPPSPPLSPDEAIKTLRIAPGYRVELVAAEPLVQDPISVQFDADGRLWVCEMRGYMPDVDATNEERPIGRVSILQDTNGDGRMDKQTIFADGLVLPRVAVPYRDGAFVAAPPYVWFMRDTDGDGRADDKQLLATDYTNRSNPEHQPNAMMPGLDNWVYNADWPGTFRYRGTAAGATVPPATRPTDLDPRWLRVNLPTKGQYGLTQDDTGRQFANTNSDQLRGDQLPLRLMSRNPEAGIRAGLNVQLADSQLTYPVRPTPGINRGYQPKMLDDQGYLRTVTAACSPMVYRSDRMPELAGNVLICEPSGNLIKRNVVSEQDGIVSAVNTPYEADTGRKADFLASTDERFRPVSLATGPDGAIYVADLYRGVLQHNRYVTPYLRKQIFERELENPVHMGRIWRIVPDRETNPPRPTPPDMLRASAAEIVPHLSNASGWWRDNAQQQIIARGDLSVVPALRSLATSGQAPLGRLHALYTLQGLDQLDESTLLAAIADRDDRVRTAAIRLSEPFLSADSVKEGSTARWMTALQKATADASVSVRVAVLMVVPTLAVAPSDHARLDALCLQAYDACAKYPYKDDALISGLAGQEIRLLTTLLAPDHNGQPADRSKLLTALAACVMRAGRPADVERALSLLEAASPSQRTALIAGMTGSGDKKNLAKPVRLAAEPSLLASWRKGDAATKKQAVALSKVLNWPGKPADPDLPPARPMTKPEQASFERGRTLFAAVCAACHEADGNGSPGKAPSMRGSTLLLGNEGRPIRIVLQGLRGKVVINGESADMEMPTLAALDDGQIADALTYVRREWEHRADPVSAQSVAAVRGETKERGQPWAREEISALKFPGEKKSTGGGKSAKGDGGKSGSRKGDRPADAAKTEEATSDASSADASSADAP